MMGTDITYRPEVLSPDECWSLLRETSFPGKSERECGKFEDVGKKIANKCKGLPLAAIVLGRHLQDKNLEGWKDVEKSGIWELENAKVDLFPHLFLSYNELSPALKRCFSYCAFYPKDHRIHTETLIEAWILQGYLNNVRGNGAMELKGREYLENLAMRCLFQDIEKSESGEHIEWCKMHDIVHDFAVYLRENDAIERSCQTCGRSLVSLVQKYRTLSWNYGDHLDEKEKSCQVCDCMKSLRVLSIYSEPPPLGMDKLIHLRRLDVSWIPLSKDDLKILCRLYFLETLLLSGCDLIEIPQDIGNLVQLRRLDLDENEELKELPESICSLVKLQYLLIKSTDINCLPEALGELSNLRRLHLSDFKVGSQYNKLGFLKKLYHCLHESPKLKFYWSSMSEMEKLVEDARATQVKTHLQKLKALVIYFMDAMNEIEQSSSSVWMELLEALVPLHNLEELEIRGYKGSRLPHLMSSPLNFIKRINLTNLSEVSSLPAMGKLPFLEILSIYGVKQLEFVGREFLGIESSSCGDDVVAFPKLIQLEFSWCYKWEEWEDITEEEEESATISIMPCLRELNIRHCESLKKLPHRLLHKVSSSLRWLNINGSSELVKTYGEDKEGSAWRSISQHNPQLRLRQQWY